MAGASLPNRPSLIETRGHRFLILDAPSDSNLHLYIREMKANSVKHLVVVCDCTYSLAKVTAEDIDVHYWPFADGDAPPDKIVSDWLDLVEKVRKDRVAKNDPSISIAVHCVAGLGRAPVLVAIALIESGLEPLDAISFIRERRRGAINSKQMRFLETYKRRRKMVVKQQQQQQQQQQHARSGSGTATGAAEGGAATGAAGATAGGNGSDKPNKSDKCLVM